jgi:hypothetical protein
MFDFKFQPESYFTGESNSISLARLSYPESTWGEQISIYAHLLDGKITFEVIDFYGNDYLVYPSSTWEPLSFEDMIYLIEGMQVNQDLMGGSIALVLDGIPEVDSEVYPELKKYFEEKRKNFGLD